MQNIKHQVKKIPGPIAIFGAGGFVGFNLLQKLLAVRKDVFGVFSGPSRNWRIKKLTTPPQNVVKCDLLDGGEVKSLISRTKPKTVFNLAAYGAYSTQQEIDRIYKTNFNSTYLVIEELKKYSFSAYIHAGSQSEYGLNCAGPSEDEELIPDSHYAISKTAVSYMVKYYGKIETLPVVHLRLYSVYGPWEEPSRLIPTLIREAKKGRLPKFVDPNISRDFVYVDDVMEAMIVIANALTEKKILSRGQLARFSESGGKLKAMTDSRIIMMTTSNPAQTTDARKIFFSSQQIFGEAFNVCTGKKTTIRELAYLAKKIFKIKQEPKFGSMKNRDWDLKDWYGNPKKIQKVFGWRTKTDLEKGLMGLV